MEVFIRKIIAKWCLQKISELDYCNAHMRRDWTFHSKPRPWSSFAIGEGDSVARLDPFSLENVGIYKRLSISKSTLLVELAGLYLEKNEWVTCFEKNHQNKRF